MAKKILLIATNTGRYESGLKTGLWLSELSHIYHAAVQERFEITIVSPKGGEVHIDPESVKPLVLDRLSKEYLKHLEFMELLRHTKSLGEVAEENFDCIYLAGGHGTMYDFPHDINIQNIIKKHFEGNKLVAAICHGVGGLLNIKLSNGNYLIEGRRLTGFDWFEETIAGRKKQVPFNLEAALKERGVKYNKAFIPMTSKVVVDGNLITGQNPFSSKRIAKVVIEQIKNK